MSVGFRISKTGFKNSSKPYRHMDLLGMIQRYFIFQFQKKLGNKVIMWNVCFWFLDGVLFVCYHGNPRKDAKLVMNS